MGYELARFNHQVDKKFQCEICAKVLENPVQSQCEHIFCKECIKQWLEDNDKCPVDRSLLVLGDLKPTTPQFRNLLNKLEIQCDFQSKGCRNILKLENLRDHCSTCTYNPTSEIICDKGCNLIITRHDYEVNNCISHLSKRVIDQEKEIANIKNTLAKLIENLEILNSPRWQLCYNMHISFHEPNILEYDKENKAGELALVQSVHSLAPDNTHFKIQILDVGLTNVIAIGLTRKGNPIDSQPGWREGSIGYHGDDGYLYDKSAKKGEEFGPKFQNGDIIECGIIFPSDFVYNGDNRVTVYFSRNEKLVGERIIKMPPAGLFPTVGMLSPRGKVKYLSS